MPLDAKSHHVLTAHVALRTQRTIVPALAAVKAAAAVADAHVGMPPLMRIDMQDAVM